jgi:hypothetical protein
MVSSQRRTASRVLAASTTVALLLAGCSSSGGASPGASTTTPGTTTPGTTTPGTAAPGATTPGTAARSESSSRSASATTGAESGAAQVLNYRIAYRRVTQTRATPKGTTVYPQVVVTGGSDAVRASVTKIVDGRIAAERQQFLSDANDVAPAAADGVSDQEISVAKQSRWGWLYNVQLSDYRGIAGTAHPVTNVFAVTVDLRTGKQVRTSDVFARLAPVDTAVKAALKSRSVEPEALGLVTVGTGTDTDTSTGVDTYPTPTGLWVGLSQCIATCALGVVEVTIPWRKLPTPRPGVLPPTSR